MRWWMVQTIWAFILLGWLTHYYEPEWMTREVTDGGEGAFENTPTATNYPKSDYIDYMKYHSGGITTASATWFSPPGYETVIRIPGSSNVDIQVRP